MKQTIETALADLAKEHDATTIALSYRGEVTLPEYLWDVGFHWQGFSRSGISYASGYGATPAAAMVTALASMKELRTPLTLNDATVDFAEAA